MRCSFLWEISADNIFLIYIVFIMCSTKAIYAFYNVIYGRMVGLVFLFRPSIICFPNLVQQIKIILWIV